MPPKYKIDKKMFSGAYVRVVVADQGNGKSTFFLNHPKIDNTLYLDLEEKVPELKKAHGYDIKRLDNIDKKGNPVCVLKPGYAVCNLLDDNYMKDETATYDYVKKYVREFVANCKQHGMKRLVIDGINDLREFAAEKWKKENNKDAVGRWNWQHVDAMVKDVIYPPIHWARRHNGQLDMAVFWGDVYKDGEKTGKVDVNLKDYIMQNISETLALSRRGTKFYAWRRKSPKGPLKKFNWTVKVALDKDNDDISDVLEIEGESPVEENVVKEEDDVTNLKTKKKKPKNKKSKGTEAEVVF